MTGKIRIKRKRIVYVMTDGGALPAAWSKHVRELKRLGWIAGVVTTGHAYGGDLEAVNLHTGLIAAKKVLEADIIIVMMGPGIVGTGTKMGFSGMEVAEVIHAATVLQGLPVAIPRISGYDSRERHKGISHHSLTALGKVTLAPAVIALPETAGVLSRISDRMEGGLPVDDKDLSSWIDQQVAVSEWPAKHCIVRVGSSLEEVQKALSQYPEPILTMGRSFRQDPCFFLAISAAAKVTLRWLILDEKTGLEPSRRTELAKKLAD